MSNRYPGTCSKCGKPVAAGAGECEKIGGRWVVSHTECPPAPKPHPDDRPVPRDNPYCCAAEGLGIKIYSGGTFAGCLSASFCKAGQFALANGLMAWARDEGEYHEALVAHVLGDAHNDEIAEIAAGLAAIGHPPVDRLTFTYPESARHCEHKAGQVIRHQGRWYVITAVTWRPGHDEDFGSAFCAVRPATDEEAAPLIAAETARDAAKAAEARRAEIAKEIRTNGTKPAGDNHPEGDRHSDRQSIYGGGDWFVVGPAGIWYVQNNGADGDTWDANNVVTGGAGAIGWVIPFDAKLAAEIAGLPA